MINIFSVYVSTFLQLSNVSGWKRSGLTQATRTLGEADDEGFASEEIMRRRIDIEYPDTGTAWVRIVVSLGVPL
jgi:hypothetical protein